MSKYFLALALLSLSSLPCDAAELSNLVVHVTGLNNDKGVVRIALFNDAAKYKADDGSGDGAFQRAAVHISNRQASETFKGVPHGSYAIKLFHDEENSGKFLKNPLGIPKVQYGFSNNARGHFGPAAVDKARFVVNTPEVKQDISVK